ncbi:hypothetical protein AOQ84DRAFT_390563 [Glonium stellatum]|uniref:Uncharacterized protein n=1 Tax=Glonium stellatum TaxID=574774 RepID=A0A8E2EW19_9PEZI|nr:hypothetical protein AOQ84DRAFT_390563 [Glonium stellatum]
MHTPDVSQEHDIGPLPRSPQRASVEPDRVRCDETFEPIPFSEDYKQPNEKPFVLKPAVLILVILFNLGCITSIAVILAKAGSDGIYRSTYSSVYFVGRYAPGVVGTITTLTYISISQALARILPYMYMAASDETVGQQGCKTSGLRTVGSPFIPVLAFPFLPLESRQWLKFGLLLGRIVVLYITGLKSGFLGVAPVGNEYIITAHMAIAWALISIYLLDVTLILWVLIVVCSCPTGLKWDPTTIADQISLFHDSTVLDDFRELEASPNSSAHYLLQEKNYRLRYWKKGDQDIIRYGIGRAVQHGDSPTSARGDSHSSVDHQTHQERPNAPIASVDQCTDQDHKPFCGCNKSYSTKLYPYSRNPVFAPVLLYFWFVIILASICLCIYTLAAGQVRNGFSLENTWYRSFPHANGTIMAPGQLNITSTTPFDNIGSFAPDPAHDLILYILVFRSLPTFFASFFAVGFMNSIDQSHRLSQPFANMFAGPATASSSILLDYLWGIPGAVTISALQASHYDVALFSAINMLSPAFPILVGGLFTITNTGTTIRFTYDMFSFSLVFAYLLVYLFTLPFAWPRQNRRLLRFQYSIADLMSMCYASVLLRDPALDLGRQDMRKEYLRARLVKQEEEGVRYTTGLYTGVDGEMHFGFDVVMRKGEKGEKGEETHVKKFGMREWDREGGVVVVGGEA